MSIQGSTVLVTGANRGIGKSFAEALLDRGARKVYAAVRNVSTITDPRVVPIQLDVTDPDRVAAVARELDDVQVVVNNAGVLHVGVPLSASLDVASATRRRARERLKSTTIEAAMIARAHHRGSTWVSPVMRRCRASYTIHAVVRKRRPVSTRAPTLSNLA